MPLIAAYHRPVSVDEALSQLTDARRKPLGGGTVINADREKSDLEVVDLQALGLSGIEPAAGKLRIGATTSLAEITDSPHVPETLRELSRRDQPASVRSVATIGGTIASREPDSTLLAALLVHDAQVEFAGADDRPLVSVLAAGVPAGSIITAVVIDPSGVTTVEATGRTPADTPIVAAVARSAESGTTVALTGVAATPVLVSVDDPTSGLEPPGDFRGSPDYRRHLASTLSTRALGAIR